MCRPRRWGLLPFADFHGTGRDFPDHEPDGVTVPTGCRRSTGPVQDEPGSTPQPWAVYNGTDAEQYSDARCMAVTPTPGLEAPRLNPGGTALFQVCIDVPSRRSTAARCSSSRCSPPPRPSGSSSPSGSPAASHAPTGAAQPGVPSPEAALPRRTLPVPGDGHTGARLRSLPWHHNAVPEDRTSRPRGRGGRQRCVGGAGRPLLSPGRHKRRSEHQDASWCSAPDRSSSPPRMAYRGHVPRTSGTPPPSTGSRRSSPSGQASRHRPASPDGSALVPARMLRRRGRSRSLSHPQSLARKAVSPEPPRGGQWRKTGNP